MHTHASAESELRLSGLQLPDVSELEPAPAAAPALSICQTTTYRWSLTDDLVHYARAGIGAIGLYRPKVEEFDEDLVLDLIRSSNLLVSSVNWIGGFTGSDGNPQSEALYDAFEAMRLAAAVGAGTVSIVTGGLGRHIGKQARRLLCDALNELCDEAEQLEVRLALHPFSCPAMKSRSLVRSLDDALGIIDKLDRPRLGLILDLQEVGSDPHLAAIVPQAATLVHCVRLSDHRCRHGRRRRHLGEKALGHADLLRDLVGAGYDGPIELDLFSDQDRPIEQYEPLVRQCRAEFDLFQSAIGMTG